MNVLFPFPDRENSMNMFRQDHEYGKIPPENVALVFDKAWQTGVDAAERLLSNEETPLDFFRIAEQSGITVINKPEDNVAAQIRFYSEFYPKDKTIYMYTGSIQLWCVANELSIENGRMLILSHEFFHYLEFAELGWVSKQNEVYMFKLGKLEMGKTGIPMLSEIAANAFAYTCFPHLKINEEAEIEYEVPEKPSGTQKKITFWNRRVEELHEVYNQFFKF